MSLNPLGLLNSAWTCCCTLVFWVLLPNSVQNWSDFQWSAIYWLLVSGMMSPPVSKYIISTCWSGCSLSSDWSIPRNTGLWLVSPGSKVHSQGCWWSLTPRWIAMTPVPRQAAEEGLLHHPTQFKVSQSSVSHLTNGSIQNTALPWAAWCCMTYTQFWRQNLLSSSPSLFSQPGPSWCQWCTQAASCPEANQRRVFRTLTNERPASAGYIPSLFTQHWRSKRGAVTVRNTGNSLVIDDNIAPDIGPLRHPEAPPAPRICVGV